MLVVHVAYFRIQERLTNGLAFVLGGQVLEVLIFPEAHGLAVFFVNGQLHPGRYVAALLQNDGHAVVHLLQRRILEQGDDHHKEIIADILHAQFRVGCKFARHIYDCAAGQVYLVVFILRAIGGRQLVQLGALQGIGAPIVIHRFRRQHIGQFLLGCGQVAQVQQVFRLTASMQTIGQAQVLVERHKLLGVARVANAHVAVRHLVFHLGDRIGVPREHHRKNEHVSFSMRHQHRRSAIGVHHRLLVGIFHALIVVGGMQEVEGAQAGQLNVFNHLIGAFVGQALLQRFHHLRTQLGVFALPLGAVGLALFQKAAHAQIGLVLC